MKGFSNNSYVFMSADSAELDRALSKFLTPSVLLVNMDASKAFTCPHAVPLQNIASLGASMALSRSGQTPSMNFTISTYSRTLSTAGYCRVKARHKRPNSIALAIRIIRAARLGCTNRLYTVPCEPPGLRYQCSSARSLQRYGTCSPGT